MSEPTPYDRLNRQVDAMLRADRRHWHPLAAVSAAFSAGAGVVIVGAAAMALVLHFMGKL